MVSGGARNGCKTQVVNHTQAMKATKGTRYFPFEAGFVKPISRLLALFTLTFRRFLERECALVAGFVREAQGFKNFLFWIDECNSIRNLDLVN